MRVVAAVIAAIAAVTASQQQQPVLREIVGGVTVSVSVYQGDKSVSGLKAADFELLDNGVPQTISAFSVETQPIDVTLLLDLSRSVAGKRLERLKVGVVEMADLLRKDDRLRLISVQHELRLIFPFQPGGTKPNVDKVTAFGGTALYGLAAYRYLGVHRRRPAVVLLSLVTAFALLALAMFAIAYGRNWQASWWEWHVLMGAAFGFVAYSAYVQFQREGSARGLFDSITLEQTVDSIRRDHRAALEELVAAMDAERRDGTSADLGRAANLVADRFDLTERQVAQDALQVSEEQFRALARNVPGVVYLCEGDRWQPFRFVSQAVEQLTGVASRRFCDGRAAFRELLHPDDDARVAQDIQAALSRRRPFHVVYRLRHTSGDWRWVEEHGQGIRSDGDSQLAPHALGMLQTTWCRPAAFVKACEARQVDREAEKNAASEAAKCFLELCKAMRDKP